MDSQCLIMVKVGDRECSTYFDKHKVQRFTPNLLFMAMLKSGLDLNELAFSYYRGEFSKEQFLEFYLGINYSVCGFEELPFFKDLEIQNPLQEKKMGSNFDRVN